MHGDFTRWTYRPERAFRSVLLQQGRVLLDADWNEQTEITAHHDEQRTLDIVGRAGGPAPDPGVGPGAFAIVAADGSVPDGVPWEELFVTAPGTYYVDGILVEAAEPSSGSKAVVGWQLGDQPYLPATGGIPGLAEPPEADGNGAYALYLDVWTHHVTPDEDPSLLESALGGPDTTTRARTVWQVRWAPLPSPLTCSDLHDSEWLQRTPRQMAAGLRSGGTDPDPCRISTTGGYRRLENQLYRVQIHLPGDGGTPPTYVWSRDNGTVVAGITAITATTSAPTDALLVLDRQGRDEELSFRQDDLVEVTSSDLQLRGQPGFLATAGAPDGLELPVSWLDTAPTSLPSLGRAPIVRRWDGGPDAVSAAPGGRELEDGIVVRFPTGGSAVTGDYWLIPARTVRLTYGIDAVSGTIDWPRSPAGAGLPVDPVGVRHHLTPLAIIRRKGAVWRRESDCRLLFPSLTDLVTLDLVGGDGQEAMPGDVLAEPVRVVVRRGGLPVRDAAVRFGSASGELAVESAPAGPAAPVSPAIAETVTGADGVAAVFWRLDPTGPTTQTLHAQRVDDHGAGTDVQVIVTGRLSVASQVQWAPACSGFTGTRTVQDALAKLAATVEMRLLGGEGQTVSKAGTVAPQAVRVIVDSPCGPAANTTVVATASGKNALVAPAKQGQPTPGALTGATSSVTVTTDEDGVAAFFWQPAFAGAATSDVLDIALKGDGAPIRVNAQLLEVSGNGGGRTGGVHITGLRFANADGGPVDFENNSNVPVGRLASGISVDLDGPVVLPSVIRKPVVRVILDLPWPLSEEAPLWSEEPIGFRSVELAADLNAEGDLMVWTPGPRTADWIRTLPERLAKEKWPDPILGRFVVDGWAIVSARNPEEHLNGHAQAVVDRASGRTLLKLPTDDEVTGGVFEQWFRLGGEQANPLVPVPNIVGLTQAQAKQALAALGLTVGQTTSEPAGGVTRNRIVRTEPAAGEEVGPGTLINLVISTGANP